MCFGTLCFVMNLICYLRKFVRFLYAFANDSGIHFYDAESRHNGTGVSAGSAMRFFRLRFVLLPGMFVSTFCRRGSHGTLIHQSWPSDRGDTKMGVVCPAAVSQKWFRVIFLPSKNLKVQQSLKMKTSAIRCEFAFISELYIA